MKIQTIFNTLKTARAKNLERRELSRFDKLIRIHDKNTYGDSYNQMMGARKILANYAQKKGVTIDIYDANKLIENDETVPSTIKDYVSDKINVVVRNILTGKFENKIISANTDKIHPKIAKTTLILPDRFEESMEVVKHGYRNTSDTFLRHLYRNIEELTRNVTGKNSK